jgi:poly(3-hydroxybutyrate) depolymerase
MNVFRCKMMLAALAAMGIAGCAVPQDQNVPNPSPLIVEPVTGRAYKLYVSSKYDRNKPAPVLVNLHGTAPWDTADLQMGEWKKIAEDYGAILVCPTLLSSDGIFPAGDGGMHDLLLKDERFVLTILGELQYRYNVDRQNIFLSSWSGGGYPLWFIGLRHPEIFAAICSRQSTFRRSIVESWFPDESRRTPILIFYGTFDFVPISVQSQEANDFLREKGFMDVQMITTPGGHVRHPEVAMEFFLKHWRHAAARTGTDARTAADGRIP